VSRRDRCLCHLARVVFMNKEIIAIALALVGDP
jgi:hypothetical protein